MKKQMEQAPIYRWLLHLFYVQVFSSRLFKPASVDGWPVAFVSAQLVERR